MPEKDGSEDKKSTKSVVNRKQKQFMNQEEQLDLSSVAESFGGRIVGEPVELNETPALLAIPAIKYGVPAAAAVGMAGYDYYKKMRGEKGIFPSPQDYSNVAQFGKEKAKQVLSKIQNIFKSKKKDGETQNEVKPKETPTEKPIRKKPIRKKPQEIPKETPKETPGTRPPRKIPKKFPDKTPKPDPKPYAVASMIL